MQFYFILLFILAYPPKLDLNPLNLKAGFNDFNKVWVACHQRFRSLFGNNVMCINFEYLEELMLVVLIWAVALT